MLHILKTFSLESWWRVRT